MSINCYLAMTAGEFCSGAALPQHMAWMACHFSCYGKGLSNLPKHLPQGSLVILNDRTPFFNHDSKIIAEQLEVILEKNEIFGFLLDFQRPGCSEVRELAAYLTEQLPCPVAVSDLYAKGIDSPVFLSAVPPHRPLKEHLHPWEGRDVWLEVAPENEIATVTEKGSHFLSLPPEALVAPSFFAPELHCHYRTKILQNQVEFTFSRRKEDIPQLLTEAGSSGVSLAVGLYQQLR